MPLTEKGSEIKNNMTKEYGEKKGTEVFYASKNSGKITGVDDMPDMTSGQTPSDLPTLDQFRKAFKDAMNNGASLSYGLGLSTAAKCLDLGQVWGTTFKKWQTKDAFKAYMKKALQKGFSADQAIKISLDAIKEE